MPRKKLDPTISTIDSVTDSKDDSATATSEPDSPARRRRARSVKAKEPAVAEAAPEPTDAPVPAEPESPVRRRRARRSAEPVDAAKAPEAAPAYTESVGDADDAMPILQFRKPARKSDRPAKALKAQASVEFDGGVTVADGDPELPVPSFRPFDRKRANSAAKVQEVDESDAVSVAVDASPRGSRRGRGSKSAAVSAAPKPESEDLPIVAGEEIVFGDLIVTMRPIDRSRPTPVADSDDASHDDEPREERRGRRRRGRSGRGEREVLETAEEVQEVDFDANDEAEAPPEPIVAPEPLPTLTIPSDAPQVILRNGVPTLVRNHRAFPPVFFTGAVGDARRTDNTMAQIEMAAESGVHLHGLAMDFTVDLDAVDESVAQAKELLRRAVKADPDAQVLFRLRFRAPVGWQDRYPNATYRNALGRASEPSLCDEAFWTDSEKCLDAFVRGIRGEGYDDQILGVHLDRNEWFQAAEAGYDTSSAAVQAFQQWARTRYNNDEVALRAAWFDGSASFGTIRIPDYQPEGAEGEKFVRSSRKQRRYVDYHMFLSDATVRRLGELAVTAKIASDGYFLVGVSYGYTFEWSHPSSGHLALGKLLRTESVDYIAGPPSYRDREPGGTCPFPAPIDSFALNGKLYISEEDFRTSLGDGRELDDDSNPLLRTPQALESVHWRGAGAALAHGHGVNWMDVHGSGWLKTQSVWSRAERLSEALVARMETPLPDPDVAIFIDERSLAYLVDPNAFQMLVQNVRESVLRAGVSSAFYLLSDLAHREHFPESKLYIFLNAWDVRPELRNAIKNRLQRDDKVLFWLYTAALFDSGRDSLERAREVTGIAIKPQPFYSRAGTTLVNRRHPLADAFPEKVLSGGAQLEPSYFAIPEGAMVLGEYTATGLPSFVVKEVDDDPNQRWTSVFLGEPVVNPALIRALAQMAGAHVWSFQDDVVHVRPPFCTVHCTGQGQRTVALPDKYSAFDFVSGHYVDESNLKFMSVDGSTYTFFIGPKSDIEHLRNVDMAKALTVEKLPPRDANIRRDTSAFDVPVMKLGDWMSGSDADDAADEWFLRPQPALEDIEPGPASDAPDAIGRRRRRRRGRSGNGNGVHDPNATGVESHSADDLEMNVMFRRRD